MEIWFVLPSDGPLPSLPSISTQLIAAGSMDGSLSVIEVRETCSRKLRGVIYYCIRFDSCIGRTRGGSCFCEGPHQIPCESSLGNSSRGLPAAGHHGPRIAPTPDRLSPAPGHSLARSKRRPLPVASSWPNAGWQHDISRRR